MKALQNYWALTEHFHTFALVFICYKLENRSLWQIWKSARAGTNVTFGVTSLKTNKPLEICISGNVIRIVLDSRCEPRVFPGLKNTCLPFRLSAPHLFSLLADDSCSAKMRDWLGNPVLYTAAGDKHRKCRKWRSDPSRRWRRTNTGGTWTGQIEKQMTASWSRKNLSAVFVSFSSDIHLTWPVLHFFLTILLEQDVLLGSQGK